VNKTAIKNFAVWARRKLISDITYKAGLLGINEAGISEPLPISTDNIQFFDIGTGKPTEIANDEIKQRKGLVTRIREKESTSDYKTAYQYVVEEVAYTWFNRLIAIRFMEVNDYLPSRVRVLSSHVIGKAEPDIIATPYDTDLEFTAYEQDRIMQLKDENKLDELFRMLFIKQCNKLNEVLPGLFEKTSDYTELLLNISFTDQEGIVNHLINDIAEEDFTEAVEIIGWLYQYYNEERKNEVINIYKGTVKKEDIPAATQLFTTDWVVRYMVDNSLGRYWIERNPQSKLKEKLEYFATSKSGQIQYLNEKVLPEELTFFDPCMGSGHILVYAFDVLMEIYRECGYLDRDAAIEIVEKNIFGLDIDDRAYQLAYFAVMMKARSYDRRFLTREITPKVYPIYDYTDISKTDNEELQYLIDEFKNVKQYGSLVNLKPNVNLKTIKNYLKNIQGQLSIDSVNIAKIENVILVAELLINRYTVVCTNPPYLNKMNGELKKYISKHYKEYSSDLFSVFMYKNFDYCKPNGYSAFMTPFVWMFIKTYEKLREYIIEEKSITTLIQMEYSAFEEATVPICTFVLKNGSEKEKGLYIKLSDFKGGMQLQKNKVLEAIYDESCNYFHETNESNFSSIPGKPIAYWIQRGIQNVFSNGIMLDEISEIVTGMSTGNNSKYLRAWTEIDFSKIALYNSDIDNIEISKQYWIPYNKGGEARKWYGNNEYVVKWSESENFHRARPTFKHLYLKEGLTWSFVTSGMFSARYYPEGFLWDVAGSPCVIHDKKKLYYVVGYLSTKIADTILKIINPTINCQVIDIQRLPIILNNDLEDIVYRIVENSINISKVDWDSFETSWDYKKHPLINGSDIKSAYNEWEEDCLERFNQLKINEEELNKIFIEVFDLINEMDSIISDKEVTIKKSNLKREIESFISYAVGCIFGRYSLDNDGITYAGGQWNESKFSSFIPDKDNCIPITDEEYFEDDIVGRFVEFVKVVYGKETLEENLDFIAKSLGGKGDTSREIIRNYFIKDFFKDHVKTYQKRPIYWLYDSGKQNGFKALIYMHRYTADTTGIVRVDYLHKMQKIYISEIDRMQDMIENSTHARDIAKAEKRKEKLIKQLKETKEYDEKIAHIALSRIDIDLDDGVKVNYEKVQTGKDNRKIDILAKI
jgi:type II restriction/modification system DNA methylase subunit YeeA